MSLGAVCVLTILSALCYSTVFTSNKVVASFTIYVNPVVFQVVHGTIGKWELVKGCKCLCVANRMHEKGDISLQSA